MKEFKAIKFSLWIVLFIMVFSFAAIGLKTVSQEYLFQDYNKDLTEREYTAAVVDQNVNLVFYKVGCPYCEAGKKAVLSAAEKSVYPTFYVNVESEEGQLLVKKYQVKKAATIVTLRGGKSRLSLYATKDKKDKIRTDENAIREALK